MFLVVVKRYGLSVLDILMITLGPLPDLAIATLPMTGYLAVAPRRWDSPPRGTSVEDKR